MHRSGKWFENSEEYRNALFELHNGGHPGQETPVSSCVFCMGPWDTTGMPKKPYGVAGKIKFFLAQMEGDDDEETNHRGLTA